MTKGVLQNQSTSVHTAADGACIDVFFFGVSAKPSEEGGAQVAAHGEDDRGRTILTPSTQSTTVTQLVTSKQGVTNSGCESRSWLRVIST